MELVDERPMLSCFSSMLQMALHHLGLGSQFGLYVVLVDLKALFSAKSAQEKFTEVPVNFSYLAASQVPLFCRCSYF